MRYLVLDKFPRTAEDLVSAKSQAQHTNVSCSNFSLCENETTLKMEVHLNIRLHSTKYLCDLLFTAVIISTIN